MILVAGRSSEACHLQEVSRCAQADTSGQGGGSAGRAEQNRLDEVVIQVQAGQAGEVGERIVGL